MVEPALTVVGLVVLILEAVEEEHLISVLVELH
jgi:hypothetical protein